MKRGVTKMTLTQEEEVKRIIDFARARGVQMRVIGGLAVKIQCPNAQHRSLARKYGDIDVVGYKKQRLEIMQALEEIGYIPNRRFNSLQGHRRLLFVHPDEIYDLDIFLDVFTMCHELDFTGRLEIDKYTIPLPDLILSKLQVIELTEKDVRDIFALLNDHEVGESDDPGVLDVRYIAEVCGKDWGWYKTITTNVDKVLALSDDFLESSKMKDTITSRLQKIKEAILSAPKTMKWKLRSLVGERMRWYDLPEDMVGDIQEGGAHRGTGE
jgi:hypothetical protein